MNSPTEHYSTPGHVRAAIARAVGPLPTPPTHETLARYFDQCAAFCLERAEQATDYAAELHERKAPDHTRLVATEALEFFAEALHIDAARTTPVFPQNNPGT